MIRLATALALAGVLHSGIAAASEASDSLLAADRAVAADSHKHGFVAAYSKVMAPDVRKFDSGVPAAIGHDAVQALLDKYGTDFTLDWTPEEAVVAESGELGFTWGHFIETGHARDGKEAKHYGKYLDIWRRGPDGVWRWIADMGADDPKPKAE